MLNFLFTIFLACLSIGANAATVVDVADVFVKTEKVKSLESLYFASHPEYYSSNSARPSLMVRLRFQNNSHLDVRVDLMELRNSPFSFPELRRDNDSISVRNGNKLIDCAIPDGGNSIFNFLPSLRSHSVEYKSTSRCVIGSRMRKMRNGNLAVITLTIDN